MLLHLGEEELDERRDAEEGEAQAHFVDTSSEKNSRQLASASSLRPKRLEALT